MMTDSEKLAALHEAVQWFFEQSHRLLNAELQLLREFRERIVSLHVTSDFEEIVNREFDNGS